MAAVVWQLVPVALGVMASPLAILGLVGILLSRHARRNGVGYLIGWMLATAVLLGIGIVVFTAAGAAGSFEAADWVGVVHLIVGVVCVLGAAWIVFRARSVIQRVAAAKTREEMAVAAPRLPGLVRSVAEYRAGRSFALGVAIFLNPMNISLVAAAALSIAHTEPVGLTVALSFGFIVAAAIPVAIPVLVVFIRGSRADPMLRALRAWMLAHSGYLSAGILAVVGVLQVIKALQVWF